MLRIITQSDIVTTVCQWGHCRSVAMARHLHGLKIKAVPCGVAAASVFQLRALAKVSDHIICMQPDYAESLENLYNISHSSIIILNVGPDRWVNPYHPELQSLIAKLFESYQLNPRQLVEP